MKFLGIFTITRRGEYQGRRVRVYADEQVLANEIGVRACRNKSGLARDAKGGVHVEACAADAPYETAEERIL